MLGQKVTRKTIHATTTLLLLINVLFLGGCGISGDSNNPPDEPIGGTTPPVGTQLSGAAVKGPLANATVRAHAFSQSAENRVGAQIGQDASTGADAAISGLIIPDGTATPFIVEITANTDTIDLSLPDGVAPAITVMRTAVTKEMLEDDQPFYATPLTTMAVEIAAANADKNDGLLIGNGDGTVSLEEFAAALPLAGRQITKSVGFGLDESVDIYTTPPLLTDDTDNAEEQAKTAAYRTAVEALAAVVVKLQEEVAANTSDGPAPTNNSTLNALATDLADGAIDGMAGDELVTALSAVADVAASVTVDPATLIVPSTVTDDNPNGIRVEAVERQLIAEVTLTGATVRDTTALLEGGEANVNPIAAQPAPNSDDDSHLDLSDNCPLVTNEDQLDSDADGPGNACDPDDDNDNVADASDAFPLDINEYVDTDGDGIGNNADTDDDGDGIEDTADAFPLNRSKSTDTDGDGIGNNEDDDDDNDGTTDTNDAFPLDDSESRDTDNDGIGDSKDADDDGDNLPDSEDNCPINSNEKQADVDGDGTGDACDGDSAGIWDERNWDQFNWQ